MSYSPDLWIFLIPMASTSNGTQFKWCPWAAELSSSFATGAAEVVVFSTGAFTKVWNLNFFLNILSYELKLISLMHACILFRLRIQCFFLDLEPVFKIFIELDQKHKSMRKSGSKNLSLSNSVCCHFCYGSF